MSAPFYESPRYKVEMSSRWNPERWNNDFEYSVTNKETGEVKTEKGIANYYDFWHRAGEIIDRSHLYGVYALDGFLDDEFEWELVDPVG